VTRRSEKEKSENDRHAAEDAPLRDIHVLDTVFDTVQQLLE
jgi:hypothetical protein